MTAKAKENRFSIPISGGWKKAALGKLAETTSDVLSRHLGSKLSPNGLTSLSAKAAEVFACYQGKLSLNGLTSLSDAAAAALSCYQGKKLSLTGLRLSI